MVMYGLYKGALFKLLAHLLIFALAMPILNGLLLSGVCLAQVTVGPRAKQTVAVLDFENRTKVQGMMLGRKAGDAVALELYESNLFEVLPRLTVENQLKALGFTPPLDKTALAKLGTALEVGNLITGYVFDCEVDKKAERAKVVLGIEMFDVVCRESINGAQGSGESSPKYGYKGDEDILIDEAISKAAFSAVRAMLDQKIPEGTVLTLVGNETTLNIGTKAGVEEGMELVVYRDIFLPAEKRRVTERIGKVKATRVTGTDCMASIITNEGGIRTEDRVRGIYRMPRFVPAGVAPVRRAKVNWAKLLLTLLVLWGVFELGREKYSVVRAPGNIRASASSDGSAVFISWTPETPSEGDIVCYCIYRSTSPNFAPFPVPNEKGIAGDAAVVQGNLLDVIVGNVPYYTDDTISEKRDFTITVSAPVVPGGAAVAETLDMSFQYPSPGLAVGETYYYRVITVVRQLLGAGAVTGAGQQAQVTLTISVSKPSAVGGPATPLEAPKLYSPKDGEVIPFFTGQSNKVTFQFYTVDSADEYAIEVAPSMDFAGARRFLVYNPSLTANVLKGSEVDLSIFGQPSPPSYLYWRVGAKNSKDNPGPTPLGYVFGSERRGLEIEVEVPQPPSL